MMNKTTAALVVLLLMAAGVASAQSGFGTQVNKGDADFIPIAKKSASNDDNHALDVLRVPLGGSEVTDDVFIIDMESAGASTVDFEDLLLTPWGDKKPGYKVQDADTVLKAGTPSAETVTVYYADVNNDGKYKAGDHVFIVQGANPGNLKATTSTTSYTIRLTQTPSGPAGSFVFASDSDFVSYQNAVSVLGVDMNTDAAGNDKRAHTANFEGSDAYLLFFTDVAHPFVAANNGPLAGSLLPRYAIRLGEDDFGTQVNKGDSDFTPVVKKSPSDGAQNDDNHALDVLRVPLGGSEVTDDVFVIDMESSNGAGTDNVDFEDILLTPWGDKKPGYQVQDSDTVLKGTHAEETVSVVFADVNNDGKYKAGDYVFLVQGASAGALKATTSTTSYSIRLTETPSGPAGSFVFASDNDFVAYQNAVTLLGEDFHTDAGGAAEKRAHTVNFEGSDAYLVFLTDSDNTFTGDEADDGLAAGALVPRHAIRLGKDTFGTQVNKGDSDFLPIVKKSASNDDNHALDVLRVALGGPEVTDDVFVLDMENAGGTATDNVDFEDVLLTPWGNKKPGYKVQDADTVIKGAATEETVTVYYADVNNDGKYKAGDYVFMVQGANPGTLKPSTSTTSYTIRLTETPSGPAGSFVFASDDDFIAYQNAVTLLGEDQHDSDNTAAKKRAHTVNFEGGETYLVFLTDANVDFAANVANEGLTAGALVPRHAIRLTGDVPASPSPTATSTTTATQTSTATSTATQTNTVTATQTATQTATSTGSDTGTTDAGTPGFELVALVAALGAALALVRRRL